MKNNVHNILYKKNQILDVKANDPSYHYIIRLLEDVTQYMINNELTFEVITLYTRSGYIGGNDSMFELDITDRIKILKCYDSALYVAIERDR